MHQHHQKFTNGRATSLPTASYIASSLLIPTNNVNPKVVIGTNPIPAQEVNLDMLSPRRLPTNLPRSRDLNCRATKATPEARAIWANSQISHSFIVVYRYSVSFFQVSSQVACPFVARVAQAYGVAFQIFTAYPDRSRVPVDCERVKSRVRHIVKRRFAASKCAYVGHFGSLRFVGKVWEV